MVTGISVTIARSFSSSQLLQLTTTKCAKSVIRTVQAIWFFVLSFSLSRQSVNFPIYEFAFNHCNNYISVQEWRAEDKLRGLSRQNKYSSVHGWQMCLGISGKSGRFWHVCECCCSTNHKSQVLLFGGYVQGAYRHRVAYQCQATSCFSPLCQLDFGQQFTNPYITHCLRASILKNVVSEESKFFFFKQSVLGSQKGKVGRA